jgi:hypothetical protein
MPSGLAVAGRLQGLDYTQSDFSKLYMDPEMSVYFLPGEEAISR